MCSKRYLQLPHVVVSVWHMSRATTLKGRAPQPRAANCCKRFDHLPDAVAQMRKDSVSLVGKRIAISSRRAFETTPSRRRHQDRFYRENLQALVRRLRAFANGHRFVVERDRESGITAALTQRRRRG